jgi:hypothetical protein
MKTLFATALGLGLWATAASAAPLGAPATDAYTKTEPPITEVRHGGRYCARGPAGWHFHDRYGQRVACAPPPPGPRGYWRWRHDGPRPGWWHTRERRYQW